MEIKSLENITDLTLEGLYDLHLGNINNELNYKIKIITLEDSHTGRPWKLCNDLYSNTTDIDIICDINSIYNPLTIKEGDIIFYVEKEDISLVRSSKITSAITDAVSKIKEANKGKDRKIDTNRSKDKSIEKQIEKQKNFNKQDINSANIVNNSNGNILFEDGKIILFPNF